MGKPRRSPSGLQPARLRWSLSLGEAPACRHRRPRHTPRGHRHTDRGHRRCIASTSRPAWPSPAPATDTPPRQRLSQPAWHQQGSLAMSGGDHPHPEGLPFRLHTPQPPGRRSLGGACVGRRVGARAAGECKERRGASPRCAPSCWPLWAPGAQSREGAVDAATAQQLSGPQAAPRWRGRGAVWITQQDGAPQASCSPLRVALVRAHPTRPTSPGKPRQCLRGPPPRHSRRRRGDACHHPETGCSARGGGGGGRGNRQALWGGGGAGLEPSTGVARCRGEAWGGEA